MSDTTTAWSWITDPPITFVPFDEVDTVVHRFQANLQSWGTMGGDSELSRRTNAHTGGAGFIAGLMITQLRQTRPVFQYSICGQPVALMQLDLEGGCIEIKNVATHPGAAGGGGIMVEYALNRIGHYNGQGAQFAPGIIYLETYSADSTAAYEAMGFRSQGRKEMVLDANRSVLWVQVADRWHLAAAVTSGDTSYRSVVTVD